MKKIKKIMTLLIAMVMVLSMSVSVFAAAGDRTSDTTISVTILTVGDVVTPYQVIEWVDGTGWQFTSAFSSLTENDLKEILGTPAVAGSGTEGEPGYVAPQAEVPGKITQAMANKIAALPYAVTRTALPVS